MFRIRSVALLALLGALTAAANPAAAQGMGGMDMGHARYSQAPVFTGSPTLPLTLSIVVAGGGPSDYKTTRLIGVLAGSAADAEEKKLADQFGSDNVVSFVKTFDFVIADALKLVQQHNVALPSAPAPSPTDGRALSAALYTAGVTPSGTFDVEYMLDHLVSHPLHVQIMDDIDNDPALGPKADGNYHAILTQAVLDLKAAYKL
ncbi:MAG TPA: hypothetical protein VHT05_13355 [Candidatus Elarobacter sp.]|jgi:hypothetical protein|nr:hypothetical protein [Candidatus Elarobacter sp.]